MANLLVSISFDFVNKPTSALHIESNTLRKETLTYHRADLDQTAHSSLIRVFTVYISLNGILGWSGF